MIGIILVSHSRKLALAIAELVAQMVGPDFPLAVAAGVGDDHEEIGTDAVHIAEVMAPFCEGDGAVVLMDLGSAVLSAETALELIDPDLNPTTKLRLCPAPIVEAAIAAAVQAKAGADLDAVAAEAIGALAPKQAQLTPADAQPPSSSSPSLVASGPSRSFDLIVDNPHGLHARPAANLVQLAGRFAGPITLANLTGGRGPSPARSLTSIALLQVRAGDHIRFTIEGADAEAAEAALKALAGDRFGEADGPTAPPPATVRPVGRPTAVSEGVAIGPALALAGLTPQKADPKAAGPAEEQARLEQALRQVGADLAHSAPGDAGKIMAAQALILSDPVLLDAIKTRLAQPGTPAEQAWREETTALAVAYAAVEDDYLRARAADLRDIAARVARALAGTAEPARIAPETPAILLVSELLPSEAMVCDRQKVLGIIAETGSPTAHAAIIIRSRGIPMVVGGPGILARAQGHEVALDGGSGEIWIDPAAAERAEIERRRATRAQALAASAAAKDEPAMTVDRIRIEVLANIGNASEAAEAVANGAEGVGLLRTEFVYLGSKAMPDEDSQTKALANLLAPLGTGPVVVRTPDIGADKPLAFMPMPDEHNPFLGVRGLRLSFRHPDFFASNLRAILRAGWKRDLWVMFPMVTDPSELAQARRIAEEAHLALETARTPHAWPVRLGMMVEVPAAAQLVARFQGLADFFSIGTNDLTQYLLAAERGNGDLARLQDAAHPAVLATVAAVCNGAGQTHVSVCGDAASDPLTALLLVGAGVRSLSVRPNQVATVKAALRRHSVADLRALTLVAMEAADADAVRRLAAETLR